MKPPERAPVGGDAVRTLQQFLNFIASCIRFLLGIIPALLWLCCCRPSLTRILRFVRLGLPANSNPSTWHRATGVRPQGSIQDTRARSAPVLQRMLVRALEGIVVVRVVSQIRSRCLRKSRARLSCLRNLAPLLVAPRQLAIVAPF